VILFLASFLLDEFVVGVTYPTCQARRFGEMESISWFKSYREIDGFHNEAVSLVAKKLGISEAEAMDRIASQESEIVTIQSPEGLNRLSSSRMAGASQIDQLGQVYRRQVWRTFCGVATLCTVWDLMETYGDDRSLTNEVMLFKRTDFKALGQINPWRREEHPTELIEETVRKRGMTLDELRNSADMLLDGYDPPLVYTYRVKKRQPTSADDLRRLLKDHFKRLGIHSNEMKNALLVNYDMAIAGQGSWWGGHISLMGAYDAATDSALILDVWKYTDPFWVKIDKLLESTIAVDSDSGFSRGFVEIHQERSGCDGMA